MQEKGFSVNTPIAHANFSKDKIKESKMGAYNFQQYQKVMNNRQVKSISQMTKVEKQQFQEETGRFLNKTPTNRNAMSNYELKSSRRDRSVALKQGLLDKSHRATLESKLVIHNKNKMNENARTRNKDTEDTFTAHAAPIIKDYSAVVASSLKKLKDKNYESWSMLVKLCFDSPIRKIYREDQVSTSKTDVNPVELMRFHPFFN